MTAVEIFIDTIHKFRFNGVMEPLTGTTKSPSPLENEPENRRCIYEDICSDKHLIDLILCTLKPLDIYGVKSAYFM